MTAEKKVQCLHFAVSANFRQPSLAAFAVAAHFRKPCLAPFAVAANVRKPSLAPFAGVEEDHESDPKALHHARIEEEGNI